MNKTDIINAVAAKTKLTKKDSGKAVDAVMEAVVNALKKGDKVILVGFGSFQVRKRAAKLGFNPQTREPLEIAARKVPVFKAGKGMKEVVNAKKAAAKK